MRYRQKSPVVDAWRWTGKSSEADPELRYHRQFGCDPTHDFAVIQHDTSYGYGDFPVSPRTTVSPGDWVVRVVGTEQLLRFSDKNFRDLYEPLEVAP